MMPQQSKIPPTQFPLIYDLEIVCFGKFADFPSELADEFLALFPLATSQFFYVLGMCFVGRNLTDEELDLLQTYKDEENVIVDFCCRARKQEVQHDH